MTTTIRSIEEIQAEEQSHFERLWYHESKLLVAKEDCPPESWAVVQRKRAEVEAKYGCDLEINSGLEMGMLMGELSALRWMLGDDWGNLDT